MYAQRTDLYINDHTDSGKWWMITNNGTPRATVRLLQLWTLHRNIPRVFPNFPAN